MATDLTGQPILDLQEMLLVLSIAYPQIPRIIPDGKFGENTLEAVMVFQRDFHPPVTGVVDLGTWDAIRAAYEETLTRMGPPITLRVLPHGQSSFQTGGQEGQLPLLQVMFDSLAQRFRGFQPMSGDRGTFQEAERHNTMLLQKIAGQPETGVLDRAAWDTLARLYQLFVTRTDT